jgi:predicted O-linked N-acetylglucosamine transferase (SPINDLY family)
MSIPTDPDPQLELALEAATRHHLAGELEAAEAGYGQVLAQRPDHGVALHRLGVLALQCGRATEATALLGRVLAMDPAAWRSHCSLGQALAALDRPGPALAAFRRAGELNPDCLEAWVGAGTASRALGQRAEAVAAFRRAAELHPELAERHNDLGTALLEAGDPAGARAACTRALALCDDFPVAHSNLGNALLAERRIFEARVQLERTVARWPDRAEAWYNLGTAALADLAFADAEAAFRRTLALAPDHLAAACNLGSALHAQGRHQAALEACELALRLDPACLDACNNASAAARAMGRMDQAVELLERAIALRPDFAVTHGNLGHLLKDLGRMDEAVRCFRRALELDPADPVVRSNLAYAVSFLPGCDARAILAENLQWQRVQVPPEWGREGHPNDPDPHRRLRVGYVSPDFREHCQSLFTLPLLAHHDHDRFEIFGYAGVARPDPITRRIAGLMDAWRDIARLDDAACAAQIRADRIDILVDLTMHMANGRPHLFARKPAPVQVAWLAYPGTTGLAAMDYRLTDPYLDPPGQQDDWYAETSIRLPDTFWCYDPLTARPEPGPLPALARGGITFGSLNNFCKVNLSVLALWARVLVALPGSRLLLQCQPGRHRQRVLETLGAGGVAPERIEFAPFRPRADYLALYRQVDVGLDTFPYNGHTTSLDAFWMGVPVVTRLGETVVGRAGWSQLCNLGLRELAADSDESFIRIATGLARDLPRLAGLRAGLRARMEASPLMDGPRFARNLESALRGLWAQWCAQTTR